MNNAIALDGIEVGRRLGHDLFEYRRPVHDDGLAQSVREGYTEAMLRGMPRRPADRYVRKWLQLRLNAQRRGRVVSHDVTPDLLRRIDVQQCPVLRISLTHGDRADTDWSIDRLNNDGAYAANNLAVLSTAANRIKGNLGYAEVYARSRGDRPIAGLQPVQWLRMAALMLGPCHTERPSEAPVIPLNVPIPPCSVRPIVQQVQYVFTLHARLQRGKNQLIKAFKPAVGTERSLRCLDVLAEAVHQGLKTVDPACDVWLRPDVMDAFLAWRHTLDTPAFALAGGISSVLAGGARVPATRLSSWHLPTRGYL